MQTEGANQTTTNGVCNDGNKLSKKKNAKKTTKEPKRPLTAYQLFTMAHAHRVNAASIGERSKALGDMWKALGTDEKQKYVEEHTIIKTQFQERNGMTTSASKKDTSKTRTISAYDVFRRDYFAKHKNEGSFGELCTALSYAWNELDASEKEKWKAAATLEMEQLSTKRCITTDTAQNSVSSHKKRKGKQSSDTTHDDDDANDPLFAFY